MSTLWRRRGRTFAFTKVLGLTAIVGMSLMALRSMPDLVRYLRIRRM